MNLSETKRIFSVVSSLGFICGILYANMLAHDYLSMTSVFNRYYLELFSKSSLASSDYFVHIALLRSLPLLMIMLFAYTKFHKVGTLGCVLWVGFLWGIYLSIGVLILGIKGVLLCVLGVVPQVFFYVPAYLMVIIYAYHYPIVGWNIGKTLVVMLCTLCGVVLECNINPILMKCFINIM